MNGLTVEGVDTVDFGISLQVNIINLVKVEGAFGLNIQFPEPFGLVVVFDR